MDSTLSVVLLKQLAAVPGLTFLLLDFYSLCRLVGKKLAAVPGVTFCMDPCNVEYNTTNLFGYPYGRIVTNDAFRRSVTNQIASPGPYA